MTEQKTIMVVDDEEALREILREELLRLGYKVLEAGNGEEAFTLAKGSNVDLVITDIRMPKGDGVELLENIKVLDDSKPVVFISGFADVSIEEAYDKGVEAIFTKPVKMDALLNTVRLALEPKSERWQRRAIRIEARTNVEIKLTNLEQAIRSHVLNIGKGGMFVSMNGQLPKVSAFIKFKIALDGHAEVQGTGIVRWVRDMPTDELGRGIGIEFIEFSDNCRSDFLNILNSIKTKSFIPIN